MMAFDSNLAPIVGQQITLTGEGGADAEARHRLLEARAWPASAICGHGRIGVREVASCTTPRRRGSLPTRARGRR